MKEKQIELLEKFINEKLPTPERSRVILFIDEIPITWEKLLEEFKKGGDLSNRIEKKFMEMLK